MNSATIKPKPGDHISYHCDFYSHHGIYCGEVLYKNRLYKDVVIHFEGKHKGGKIRGLSYEKFSRGREIYVVQYTQGCYYTPDVVVRRAVSKLGEPDYNLFGNNCEHFTHWCKTGEKASEQMGTAILLTSIGAIGAVSVAGAFVSIGWRGDKEAIMQI